MVGNVEILWIFPSPGSTDRSSIYTGALGPKSPLKSGFRHFSETLVIEILCQLWAKFSEFFYDQSWVKGSKTSFHAVLSPWASVHISDRAVLPGGGNICQNPTLPIIFKFFLWPEYHKRNKNQIWGCFWAHGSLFTLAIGSWVSENVEFKVFKLFSQVSQFFYDQSLSKVQKTRFERVFGTDELCIYWWSGPAFWRKKYSQNISNHFKIFSITRVWGNQISGRFRARGFLEPNQGSDRVFSDYFQLIWIFLLPINSFPTSKSIFSLCFLRLAGFISTMKSPQKAQIKLYYSNAMKILNFRNDGILL